MKISARNLVVPVATAQFALAAPTVFASQVLGGVLPADLGTALPIGLGGAAALTGLGLIVGVQLIKRRNDRK